MSYPDEEDAGKNDTEATLFLNGLADFTGPFWDAVDRMWKLSGHHRESAAIVTASKRYTVAELDNMRHGLGPLG